ncbi:MAG: excinuclease ABC subunit UvrB [Patescibacteria group bacterium]|nr:excinuclease ABC subunit UvrB [Patescibacteria group bacterium]
MFKFLQNIKPTGDQPKAIKKLVEGLRKDFIYQTLLGVTGSGKTATMAWVIEKTKRPAFVISPNKMLAAQLYQEFKSFFPENQVHYFVSYYDYYQPEAYLPETDTYIAKDARINEYLDQLRHGAIQAVLNHQDFIIISSVSCLYGIGNPEEYEKVRIEIYLNQYLNINDLINSLKILQYSKLKDELKAGSFKLSSLSSKEKQLELISPHGNEMYIIRIENKIVKEIKLIALVKKFENKIKLVIKRDSEKFLEKLKVYPAKLFVTDKEKLYLAINNIKQELNDRYWQLLKENKIIEAERLKRRTLVDIEMLKTKGYCQGIENYERHLNFKNAGEPPYTILDYLPQETIIFIDESHLTLPQIKAMARGDRKRKEVLVEHGWRLPSAIDHRPLTFEEFFSKNFQKIFVSATPGEFEKKYSDQIVEQLIRPTFIPDPIIEVRSSDNQIIDLLREIEVVLKRKGKLLILTATKRSAENLTEFLTNYELKVQYIHSDIKTLKRPEIIRKLRKGEIDILIGVNLLREGLDLPEVSLVCILDADKEGFLRNTTTLIQAIGRASRNIEGKVILYANRMTKSIKEAIEETERRRKYQIEFNKKYGLLPKAIIKELISTPLEEFSNKEYQETKEDLILFLEKEKNEL